MSVATNFPSEPGYYWAKWRIAAEGTLEGDEVTPSNLWEIVQVNDNNGEPGTLEELSVSVSGVRETQWRDGFFWGARVADLHPRHPPTPISAETLKVLQERMDAAEAVLARLQPSTPPAESPASSVTPKHERSSLRDDWHYDSQGYCDNPGRGY